MRRWTELHEMRLSPEESSSEVTSSSTVFKMSPSNSLESNDIGEVDLELWDLDGNAQNHARNITLIQNGFGIQGHTLITTQLAKSDTSSISGT